MKHALILALCLCIFLACDKDSQDLPYPVSAQAGGISIQSDLSAIPQDALTIEDAVINANILTLTVRYGGGCGDTRFELFGDGLFMESYPVQTNIMLSFKDEDPCRALLTKVLDFDLTRLATFYRNAYQTQTGTIILRIRDFPDHIRYSF
jgi:hypothetical protein